MAGGCAWQGGMPPPDTMTYGKCAGGTHPTGMHTCSLDLGSSSNVYGQILIDCYMIICVQMIL